MIDLTVYFSSIGILGSFIVAFVIHNLKAAKKDYESKKLIAELQSENTKLKTTNIEIQNKISQYEAKEKRDNENKQIPQKPTRRVISKGVGWVKDY